MGTHEPDRQQTGAPLSAGRPIVAFDFDGTLTTHDSFTAFLRWKAKPLGYALGLVTLLPHIVAYGVHRDRGRLKAAAAARFIGGMTEDQLSNMAEAFALQFAPSMLRPDAVQAWRDWRAQGALLVIVTASPELTIAPFARALGADRLIGTKLALDASGRITGKLDGRNCRGPEKVARLKQVFGQDMELAAAYGDTSGDHEMIAIAGVKGYRLFKLKP